MSGRVAESPSRTHLGWLRTHLVFHKELTTSPTIPRWSIFLLIVGTFLTARGYHSFDGDQAYRLPILLNSQDPNLYQSDPFVRSFETFNPHRGYLAVLDLASRPIGLAAALLGLFGLTLAGTALGFDRLSRSVWPGLGPKVGLVALILVLTAKAGNIGTNHLFEATLLDRLVGFALGWLAIASVVTDPKKSVGTAAIWLCLVALVHPSVGLQLAMTLAASWVAFALRPSLTGVTAGVATRAVIALGLALIPVLTLMVGQGGALFRGLPVEEFRSLAVLIQGPQHMLPSTWRAPQWLAWACYPTLAVLAMSRVGLTRESAPSVPWPLARIRLAILMAVNLASLAAAYVAVEVVGDLRVTLFQPFRMATLARGLALVAVSGRLVSLWTRGDFAGRVRATLIGVGLSGDWILVVATLVEVVMTCLEWMKMRRWVVVGTGTATLILGLVFLVRHDTESGHQTLMGAIVLLALATLIARAWPMAWTHRRMSLALVCAWSVPASALVVGLVVADPHRHPWAEALVARCRFTETPTEDLERLAVWARDRTDPASVFITPPGPKNFRLWSRRAVAFNRAASPYHAAGLGDWATRYRDHVAFNGSTSDFVNAYFDDRHALEARYGRMTDLEKATLANRQGASHVLAAAPPPGTTTDPDGPLELIKVEGRYAIYRVK